LYLELGFGMDGFFLPFSVTSWSLTRLMLLFNVLESRPRAQLSVVLRLYFEIQELVQDLTNNVALCATGTDALFAKKITSSIDEGNLSRSALDNSMLSWRFAAYEGVLGLVYDRIAGFVDRG
jgi:hypothetical protein